MLRIRARALNHDNKADCVMSEQPRRLVHHSSHLEEAHLLAYYISHLTSGNVSRAGMYDKIGMKLISIHPCQSTDVQQRRR